MNISSTIAKKLNLSENAVAALREGKGNRTIGGNVALAVGDTLTIKGIDFLTIYVPKDGMSSDEFYQLEPAEQANQGQKVEYFALLFGDGRNASISKFLRNAPDGTQFFGATYDTDAREYVLDSKAVDTSKMWKPTTRNIDKWIENGADGIVGKTAKLIGVAQTLTRNGSNQNLFAWEIA